MKEAAAKILLVEDDHFLLAMYSAKFLAEGFVIRGAMTAAEALEEANSFKPNLIILDIGLPDEDGYEVLRKLKQSKTTASIPVAVLSNLSDPSHREQALIHGALDFWIKAHLDPIEVVEKARKVLKLSS